MKNTVKASLLAVAVLALASVSAYAQLTETTQTVGAQTTIGISATVASFDSISCNPYVDLNANSPITNPGATVAQPVFCKYATNDAFPMDVTVYLPDATPLTGFSGAIIPNSNILAGPNPGSMSPLQPLSNGLQGNDGLVVLTAITPSSGANLNFYLALNVPQFTLADTYNAILTVAITPELSFVKNEKVRSRRKL